MTHRPGTARRRFPPSGDRSKVHRGVEVGLHLRPGLADEGFVAQAIGNLAAFGVQRQRGERLVWQVIRIDGSTSHHYRLVVRHPERILDVGFANDLRHQLDALSAETVEELRRRYAAAQRDGLEPVPLRHLRETVDFWRDDFWNWLG